MAKRPKANTSDVIDSKGLQDAMNGNTVPAPEPGNETAPDARERRGRRAKAVDLPGIEGPGVAPFKDKRLSKLGDQFISVRDEKSKMAEELTGVEGKIIERMKELNIRRYQFSDQEAFIVPGKEHVKIKTVKVGANGDGEGDAEDSE
jgi:hypothetical protein